MPVSHLGLTVSHVPSATSFYLAALQPLGYRYIGKQGDAVGLGINEADFFLSQEKSGYRTSPTHIAFSADGRLTVRNCYAAALDAGGKASGSPSYRSDDCSCFNAAVTDLDGNTVEFIYRNPDHPSDYAHSAAPEPSMVSRQTGDRGIRYEDDERSISSRMSKAKSRYDTVADLASASSKSVDRTEKQTAAQAPSESGSLSSNGKALVGTLLGAAAGAAFAYAMCASERENAKEEIAYAASLKSKPQLSARSSFKSESARSVPPQAYTMTEAPADEAYPPSSAARTIRAIEAPRYDQEDEEVQRAISRYQSSQRRASSQASARRPLPIRSRTYDAVEYSTPSEVSSAKPPMMLPLEPAQSIVSSRRSARHVSADDAAYSIASSRHSPRHSTVDEVSLKRHDSGISTYSHASSHRSGADKHSSAGSTRSRRRHSVYEGAAEVPLPASTVYSYNSAAHTPAPASQVGSQAGSYISAADIPVPASRVSTYVPASQAGSYISAANVPVPASRATSHVSGSKAASYISAADIPVPASRATTQVAGSQAPSYISAANVPVPASRATTRVAGSQAPSYISAANIAVPASRATTQVAGSQAPSYISAANVPVPASRANTYVAASQAPISGSKAPSYISAADVPVPASRAATSVAPSQPHGRASKAASHISSATVPVPTSRATSLLPDSPTPDGRTKAASYITAAQAPVPPSRASSYVTANNVSKASSYVSAAASPHEDAVYDTRGDESDGLGDTKTIVPEDSISCIDFSQPRKSKSRHSSSKSGSKSSRHSTSSRHSDSAKSDSTVRPIKDKKSGSSARSAMTMPARQKERAEEAGSGRRSYAG